VIVVIGQSGAATIIKLKWKFNVHNDSHSRNPCLGCNDQQRGSIRRADCLAVKQ
jgi:hypothetical protein